MSDSGLSIFDDDEPDTNGDTGSDATGDGGHGILLRDR